MNLLAQGELVVKYGAPPDFQPQPLYGVPRLWSVPVLFYLITTPIIVIASFIVGSILYLTTHKKIFIIIPLVLSFLYLIRYFLVEKIFGVTF